jgi:CelD/BcsL family acetyltransferase involved in cellulose biosynthesis
MEARSKRLAPAHSTDSQSRGTTVHENATFFSTKDFIEAWARSFSSEYRLVTLPVIGSGTPRKMYALQVVDQYRSRYVSLGPVGLYASPGWNGQLERATLEAILRRLMTFRTRGFVWNVRFDHEPLAAGLSSVGLKFERISTHVLPLKQDYEQVFAGYSATMRNHIRKAQRRGVRVRAAETDEDVRAYYEVHMKLVKQRQDKEGYGPVYPIGLFQELIKIREGARLLVAEVGECVVAGGLFFRDGSSVMYWHGASDRDYSHLFPSCAVLDEAICWACADGAEFFNFGGSAGIASLEQFKSFWGARPELNWTFEWNSPIWRRFSRMKSAIGTWRFGQRDLFSH